MADALTLKAEVRETVGKQVRHLRRRGLIPAVLYGGTNEETVSLQIKERPLAKVLAEAGTYQLISLEVDGNKPQMTLARDIQRDVIKRNYIHVDFYAVRMDEKVTAQVPVVIEGVSPAVKEGGILTQGLDAIDVECLPADLISAIAVDISGLEEFNDTISVSDLIVPSSIKILSDPESMVIKIEPPRLIVEEEDELDEALPEDGAEVEVIGAEGDDDEE